MKQLPPIFQTYFAPGPRARSYNIWLVHTAPEETFLEKVWALVELNTKYYNRQISDHATWLAIILRRGTLPFCWSRLFVHHLCTLNLIAIPVNVPDIISLSDRFTATLSFLFCLLGQQSVLLLQYCSTCHLTSNFQVLAYFSCLDPVLAWIDCTIRASMFLVQLGI